MLIKMDAKLMVDGKDVGINPFVKRFIANTVFGMVSSLNGVAEPKTITIEVKLK